MKNIVRLIIFVCVIAFCNSAKAQFEPELDTIGDNILFRKELNGAFMLHTNGWGLEFRIGSNTGYFNKRTFELDLLEYKHSKEIRTINPFYTNTKSYIYGKQNAVYIFRAGYGMQRQLNRKPFNGGVELRLFYLGGFSMAMAKPVYLNIMEWDTSDTRLVIVTEKYDPEKHFPDNIYGRASFLKGFNELKPYPGAYIKTGLGIEFGAINQSTILVEVGTVIEVFAKPVPIMATRSPEQIFWTLYVSVGIGKRYN